MRRRLNLLRGSPRFVIRGSRRGVTSLLAPRVVPNADGMYWVHGVTTARSGREIESVFRLDTDSGGELYGVDWLIEGQWHESTDLEAIARPGGSAAVLPFAYRHSVPLERDIHLEGGDGSLNTRGVK